MTKKHDLTVVAVGQRFPMPLPPNFEGCILELTTEGNLMVLFGYPGLKTTEEAMLRHGFSRFSVTSFHHAGCTLAVLVFQYPPLHPGGTAQYIEGILHAALYPDDRGERFVQGGGNMLLQYLVDNSIVRMIRSSGLDPRGVDDLRKVVQTQMGETIDKRQYDAAIKALFQVSSKDLFQRGSIYRHRIEADSTAIH